jgi:hypothetical protein
MALICNREVASHGRHREANRAQGIAAAVWRALTESGFDKIPAQRRDEALRMNGEGWDQQMRNIERYVGS